jgi:hypothetical protein
MSFEQCRPEGRLTLIDKRLAHIALKVENFLKRDNSFLIGSFNGGQLSELAIMLTEFGEDTWCEVGMWKALEAHNLRHFGNPLPFSKPENVEHSDFPFDEYRLSHFLWNAIIILRGEEYFSPHHPGLLPLAKRLARFMEKQFTSFPMQSSVKKFLSTPNTSGSIVKQKLIWIGKASYLFRSLCILHLDDNEALDLSWNERIRYIDDFLCRQYTLWSGMGVLDVLAETLSLAESQKQEVLSWHDRHFSYFEIIQAKPGIVKAKNMFTGAIYEFPEEVPGIFSPFKKGILVFGAAVPFNGKWYWSGAQIFLGFPTASDIALLKAKYLEKNSQAVYTYDEERAARAIRDAKRNCEAFLEFFGTDLVEFKTGKELAEALKAKLEYQQEKVISEMGREKIGEKTIKAAKDFKATKTAFPELLNYENGVALFNNPDIGDQIILNFFEIKKILGKRGKDLTRDEMNTLFDFFTHDVISKEVIERLGGEYGKESFAVSFFLKEKPKYWFDYLLRKYKGKDYRTRYPNFTALTEKEIELLDG